MSAHVLEVNFSFNGKEATIYPVILQSGPETILVDCGYAGFIPLIEKAALPYGISLKQLTGVIITHHDIDHMGGLFELKEKYPALKVYSSDIDEKYISGKEKSLRLTQAECIYPSLPEDQKPGALYFQKMLESIKPVTVDVTFSIDEEPSYLNGVKIINTPGHMPGHISIYLKESKTLIAADAIVAENRALEIANPAFTLDMVQAIASVKKLLQYDIKKIICYHGGVIDHDIKGQLNRLISKYTSA